MPEINANLLSCRPVQNQMQPNEGPKALPLSLDFSAGVSYSLDYSNHQQGNFSLLQAVYIDNRANGSSILMTVSGTGQVVVCPANSQGYFPVLCQNPIRVEFTSAGGVIVPIYLLNFPVAPGVWAV